MRASSLRLGVVLAIAAMPIAGARAADTLPAPAGEPPAAGAPPTVAVPGSGGPDREPRTRTDETLANAVHQRLVDDTRINAMQINVDARGGIVKLTGVVGSRGDQKVAAEIASGVPGVRSVENGLTLPTDNEPRPSPTDIPEKLTP